MCLIMAGNHKGNRRISTLKTDEEQKLSLLLLTGAKIWLRRGKEPYQTQHLVVVLP